ncbi:MAG: hypothetical protein Q7S77_02560 [Candidatus Staskawiczbacteria bacterium]|nr:hypothetical protein [Candidatus Staskawiczbacteria bacterium]
MDELNQKIYFPENTPEIISEILRKYELEETDEELDKKLLEENIEPLNGGIILDIAMETAQGKISKSEMSSILQKQFKINPKIAEDISNDIETKLVLMASNKNPLLETDNKSVKEVSPPIGIPKIGEEYKPEINIKKFEEQKIEQPKEEVQKIVRKNKKIPKKSDKSTITTDVQPTELEKTIKKQSDGYREPIN